MFSISKGSHWSRVSINFLFDALLLLAAFKLAAMIRFEELVTAREVLYLPALTVGAVTLPVLLYLSGFYLSSKQRSTFRVEVIHLFLILLATTILVMAVGSINFSARVGRGVLVLGMGMTAVFMAVRHVWPWQRRTGPLTAFVVACPLDDEVAKAYQRLDAESGEFLGVFVVPGHNTACGLHVLGPTTAMEQIVKEKGIRNVLCSERVIETRSLFGLFRRLRFQGAQISSLIHAFEDHYQMVPLELVTEQWLLNASSQPQAFYIKKLKRAFDLVVAGLLLTLLAPLCLIVAVLIKISSKGPVIYRQTRTGKFGRPFEVLKFRSMKVTAEADGKARWWQANDPRETWLGKWLRKYRVDEIPQLINILAGEMSFVGPRPERPEFVRELAEKIPFYEERLMIPPGLTGWAQVSYPYGSSIDDAARKLEYDLYYLKHMSVILDLFILLDTVKAVVRGGAAVRTNGRHLLGDSTPGVAPGSARTEPAKPTALA
ncbi:MAG: exopolysaccharide biosynthesis polyprenyl glycosylphosphotransferase [Verrucomicrobiaceae bacterium]|nr:exopolysaccharide biosynthesis polyprenyl glycosylphosphotransferase [Verrucomicrobiaceae bacterium]